MTSITTSSTSLRPSSRQQLAAALLQFGDRKPLFNTSGPATEHWAQVVKAMTDDQLWMLWRLTES